MATGNVHIDFNVIDEATPKLWDAYKRLAGINFRAKQRDLHADALTPQRPEPTPEED